MVASQTALLVIDVQAGLFAGDRRVYDGDGLVQRINAVIAQARQASVPVVFIQDKDVGPLDSPEWRLHPALQSKSDDLTIHKAYGDSFYHTALQAELAARSTQRLIVVGCKTDACVDATCRRAISLGYDVTLVADGHSTSDNQFLTAPQSIAYYNVILDELGLEDGFGNGEHSISVQPIGELIF